MERVAEVFEKAVSLEAGRRAQYLDRACAGDGALRREVESLIEAHEQAGSRFLNETPAFAGFGADTSPGGARVSSRIGPYLLQEPVGHGGMGEVFAAIRADGQYEKRVALKLVRSGYGSGFVLERFRTERQILANLDHPNIARLLDGSTTEEGTPYLVMELIEGVPIDSYCNARKLSVTERLMLFRPVCSAVQYAHQRLVIHRDIKPSNILVTPEGVPKLLDFGIAKILDASGSTEATVLRPMTPQFASPEQVRGEPVTTATDVYSLGVVLYRLLTGRLPYRADDGNSAKLAVEISQVDAPSPSGFARELRGDLDSILLKALRKEPQERYSSAEQLSEDIRRHLDGLPVAARKGTWSYRASKFLRRHTTGAAAGAALLLTLVGAVAVTQREARIAEATQRRAEARFNDVRKLANSLVFEISDSIRDVPGATVARHLILQRSLEYLDSLTKESGNDPALMRELAAAYGRIGEIQGNPMDPNLGANGAALSSGRKAIELREALARMDPGNAPDQIELAVAYLDYGEMQMTGAGDIAGGFNSCKMALAILNREVAALPDDPRVLAELERAYERLGMAQVGEGAIGAVGTIAGAITDLQEALSINRRRAERTPTDLDVRKQGAVVSGVLGDALLKLGDRPGALQRYRQAYDALTSIDPDGRNARIALNASVFMSKAGEVFLQEGRFPEAISSQANAERAIDRLVAADPRNEAFVQRLAAFSGLLGVALVESGRTEEGLRSLRKALSVAEASPSHAPVMETIKSLIHDWIGVGLERQGKLGEAVPEYEKGKARLAAIISAGAKDRRVQVYFAGAVDRLAAARLKLGETDAAQREYAQALALLEPLVRANPDDRETLYAAGEAYSGSGTLSARLAQSASARAEKLAQWQAARDWFRKSLDVWSRVSHPARIDTGLLEVTPPDEVSRRLARCDREIGLLAPAR